MPELPVPKKYIYIFLGFIGLVFVVNVLLLDYFLVNQRGDLLDFQTRLTQLSDSFRILGGRLYTTGSAPAQSNSSQSAASAGSALSPAFDDICPTSCVDLISLATLSGRVSTSNLITPTFSNTSANTTSTSTKGEFFVPMGSGSISQISGWTNVDSAQATFDAGNFGSIKAAYFEVFLHAQSGYGIYELHARLYDSTTPYVFFSSDVSTMSNSTQFVSAPITLSPGNKTYKVQLNTSMVAPGILDQARIRIVTQ